MGYLINIDTALKINQDLKKEEKNIVFTHGAFDLFHAGHSLFLHKSKKEGDVLILGLEPDSNVKKYKGRFRPIINQKQRSEIIINHLAVDFVFYIDELNEMNDMYYQQLYKIMKPSTITYGMGFAAKNRDKLKLKDSNLKKIDSGVNSTTRIISSILNTYQVVRSNEYF